jgi:hypothetical protein
MTSNDTAAAPPTGNGAPLEPLAAEFDPPSREAWLALVGKVLKGADFNKRLVSRTADGLAVQPLYTAPMPSQERLRWGSWAGIPAAGTCASATPSPTRRPPTPPSWTTSRTGQPRSCSDHRPGQVGLGYGAGPLGRP